MIRHPELKGKIERIALRITLAEQRVHKTALASLWAYGMQFCCVFCLPSSKLSSANQYVVQVIEKNMLSTS